MTLTKRHDFAKADMFRLAIVLTAGVVGCAPANPPAPPAEAMAPGMGTVLSTRAVTAVESQPALAAFLVGKASGDDQALVELIVRADDGAVLSIVQPNEGDFRKGDRVVIVRGGQTRLAPAH